MMHAIKVTEENIPTILEHYEDVPVIRLTERVAPMRTQDYYLVGGMDPHSWSFYNTWDFKHMWMFMDIESNDEFTEVTRK